jgi:hypothetical protein
MTSAEQVAELAHAVANLVAEDRSGEGASSAQVAFACRDVVVDRLGGALGAVLNAGPAHHDFPARHIANDPAHALHAALRDLPRLSGPDRPPVIDALSAAAPPRSPWHVAGRAALLLQPYEEQLRVLPGPAAWQAVHQIAAIAATLPYLDADLAHVHRGLMVDPGSHGAIRFAVAEIETRAPQDRTPFGIEAPQPFQAVPIRGLADLPNATRQLGTLIALRGERITAAERRAVARMLTEGLDVTSRALRSSGPHVQADLAASFESAAEHLTKLYTTPLATIGKPAPTIQYLAGEITKHLRALDGVLDRAEPLAPPERDTAFSRATERGLAWASEAPAVTGALESALRAAHGAANLFGHPESEATRELGLTWVRAEAPPRQAVPRVLAAARAGAEALGAARPALPTVAGRGDARAQTGFEQAEVAVDRVHAAVRARGALPSASLPEHPRTRTGSRRVADLARAAGRPVRSPSPSGADRAPPTP